MAQHAAAAAAAAAAGTPRGRWALPKYAATEDAVVVRSRRYTMEVSRGVVVTAPERERNGRMGGAWNSRLCLYVCA